MKLSDTNTSILNWFKTARPAPSLEDLCVQIGAHLEEVAEMLEALGLEPAAWLRDGAAGVPARGRRQTGFGGCRWCRSAQRAHGAGCRRLGQST